MKTEEQNTENEQLRQTPVSGCANIQCCGIFPTNDCEPCSYYQSVKRQHEIANNIVFRQKYPNGMTKEQALEALKMGCKITHRFFSADEFIKLTNLNSIMYETEDGFTISPLAFWLDKRDDSWQKDWKIFSPVR